VEDLRRAVSIQPRNSDYLANLGYALWRVGRFDESVTAERSAIKANDANFTAHYQLGRFLLRQGQSGQLAEAIVHLRRALEIDSRQYEVRLELITAYRAAGDRAQAASQLELLGNARPSDPRVFYASALLATDRGDLPAAIKDFKEALHRDPTLYEAWRDLGLALVKSNQWPAAEEAFAELARRQPAMVDAAYLHGLALFNIGRVAEAETEVRRALRLNAGAAEAHTLLGVILASRGNANAEAVDALTQAIALNPNSFDALFYLGRVFYTQRDYQNAALRLREAVKLNPTHGESRFFLGTAMEAAGES